MGKKNWEFSTVNVYEPYILNSVRHTIDKGDTLYKIVEKYYADYISGESKEPLPTKGYTTDVIDSEVFKWDVIHSIMEMNNLIHPKLLPVGNEIYLPNFKFEDKVNGKCVYGVKNEKKIGIWTIVDEKTEKIVSRLENVEVFVRTETEWKILMDKEWLDDSAELAFLTSGILALSIYSDKNLPLAEECGGHGFFYTRRPNLLEIRNIFNSFFYKNVDLPSHFFEINKRYFPSTIVLAKFLEKYIPIFLKMDAFIFGNFNESGKLFVSENIKALGEQSASIVSNDILVKSILEGSLAGFTKAIALLVSIDEKFFPQSFTIKLGATEKDRISEVRKDLNITCKILIVNSLVVFGIVNNLYQKEISFRKSALETMFDSVIGSIPIFKPLNTLIKQSLKVVKTTLIDSIVSTNSLKYDEKFKSLLEKIGKQLEKLALSKVISKETWDTIDISIGTALDRVKGID